MIDRFELLRAQDDVRRRQAQAALKLGGLLRETRTLADEHLAERHFGFTAESGRDLHEWADRYETRAQKLIEAPLSGADELEEIVSQIEADLALNEPLTWDEERALREELKA